MIDRPGVIVDPRTAADFLRAIIERKRGYTPEWTAPAKSAGYGLAAIAARYLETVGQRLNQAPDKHKLAFLDLAGLGLVAADAARAVVVFDVSPDSPGGSAPQGTPLGAKGPSGQILFETESRAGVTAGKLVQVVSLWPGRDEYVDHTAAFLAGAPIRPFATADRIPTPHHLYLSHPVLLALTGDVELHVEFELTHGASAPLDIEWEYWDGVVWRGFQSTAASCGAASDLRDSTNGLTESGNYVLLADCAQAAKTKVNETDGFWLRGRLTEPLPPDGDQTLPEVDGVRISSTVNQALRGRIKVFEPTSVLRGELVTSALFGTVTNEAGHPVEGVVIEIVDPHNPTRAAFTSAPTTSDGEYSIPNVAFGVDYSFRGIYGGLEFSGPLAEVKPKEIASDARPRVDLRLYVEGLPPEKAFADGSTLDTSKPFYPFGQLPQPGSSFYVACEEAFAKPGARVRVYVARTRSPQDDAADTGGTELSHLVIWEYWNGRLWAPLAVTSNVDSSQHDLDDDEILDFTVPIDMEPLVVNQKEARWVRARLQSGSFGVVQQVTFITGTGNGTATNTFKHVIPRPPVLAACRIGYTFQYGPFHPERVFTYSDFRYRDQTEAASWPGATFLPFERVADVTPALYLGFDAKPPADQLGIFADVVEDQTEPVGPALLWEYWNGFEWTRLPVSDETGNLRRAGIAFVITQEDDASVSRFGTHLHFVRARLKEDGPPGEPLLGGIFPNAVWAAERHTLRDLPVGRSAGTPDQVFVITQTPILPGETLEVRELNGTRANVEWRILVTELSGGDDSAVTELDAALAREGTNTDVVSGPVRLRRNRRKEVTEAWVRWESRESLHLSGPEDRHYALDRATGRLRFGDGTAGKVPPVGAAVLVREMRSGGGAAGNVAAKAISQLLGSVPGVGAVYNPRAAEGGADGETGVRALVRGPLTLRHRGRAVAASDYETLAREASPAVALARAIPGRNPAGVRSPGWITLIVVPESDELHPYPSFGLREEIRKHVESRAPAELGGLGRIVVTGPNYVAVDVAATIAPTDPSLAGAVEAAARETLQRFLHPLHGGPSSNGWDLGRDVFLSDIAAELERTPGVDFVEELALLRGGVPQGESFVIADEELVTPGAIALRLIGAG